MSADRTTLEETLVTERELLAGRAAARAVQADCAPSARSTGRTGSPSIPEEAGYWSVTTADDVHEVSHDWQTYSSELGGITALTNAIMPLELIRAMFIGMDPPKHDRLKMLFQRGFTPKRIAEHEEAIRAITVGVLDRLDGREECDLVTEVAQPVVSRVIEQLHGDPAGGRRDLGPADERHARRGRSGPQPGGSRVSHAAGRAGDLRALPVG